MVQLDQGVDAVERARSAARSTPSVTSSTIGLCGVEVEGGQLARRHVADQRLDQRVEPQVFAVPLR